MSKIAKGIDDYDADLARMRTLLAELENQMFTDGI